MKDFLGKASFQSLIQVVHAGEGAASKGSGAAWTLMYEVKASSRDDLRHKVVRV